MKKAYLKYYEQYAALAPLAFLWASFRAPNRIAKRSLANRQKDYTELAKDLGRLSLHYELNRQLLESTEHWDSYDYGEGYFYQGCDLIGITGLRDTRARFESMGLADLLEDRTVLEIGCNSGFLALYIAQVAKHVSGFDINPYLIRMADITAQHLGLSDKVDFATAAFEDYRSDQDFDVVLSFANHSTYDGQTAQSVEEYFERCRNILVPGGLFLFESHHPGHEGDKLEAVCDLVGKMFSIEDRRTLDEGSYLDRGRTFIIARRA